MNRKELPIFCFTSHYSLSSVLTLDEPKKVKPNGPQSIIKICKDYGLKKVVLVETSFGGFFEALENCQKENLDLVFGYKVEVVSNALDKTEESEKTSSKIIIFIKNGEAAKGYKDLIKLHNFSTTTGFYKTPRLDWKTLKELFTENLHICIPFYSSYLAKNTLYLNHCAVPDFSFLSAQNPPTIFYENSGHPFDLILLKQLSKFPKEWPKQFVRSVYYEKKEDFLAFLTYKCIVNRNPGKRSTIFSPNLSHMGSQEFCIENCLPDPLR